jgi:hypothetical protein
MRGFIGWLRRGGKWEPFEYHPWLWFKPPTRKVFYINIGDKDD